MACSSFAGAATRQRCGVHNWEREPRLTRMQGSALANPVRTRWRGWWFRLVQDWKSVHSGISISYPDKAVSANEAREVAEKIRLSLAMPYHLTLGQTASASAQVVRHCSASMGVVLFRNHDASQDDILRWADVAMYQAKDA